MPPPIEGPGRAIGEGGHAAGAAPPKRGDSAAAPGFGLSRRADLTALLGAFCFFLSAVEYMIPKPLPFMRLGIANLPILLAVEILPLRWFLVLALVKVIGMSLVSGTLFSYVAVFSLVGTLGAALAMWGTKRAGRGAVSFLGVSVAGAVVSNALQVLLASVLVFGEAARLIAPVFLGMGLATGALLGLFAERFVRSSRWYARALGGAGPGTAPSAAAETETAESASAAAAKAPEGGAAP